MLIFSLIFLLLLQTYGPLNKSVQAHIHAVVERSLEYRNDLKLHMQIARTIEEKYNDLTLGAPFTMAQILALPELGYVDKKLDVMIYEFPCQYGGIRNFKGLKEINIYKTVWVDYKAGLISRISEKFPYPVSPMDKVIEEMQLGDRQARLFMGGFAIEQVRIIVQEALKRKYIKGI